jgi:hypothetical protein
VELAVLLVLEEAGALQLGLLDEGGGVTGKDIGAELRQGLAADA